MKYIVAAILILIGALSFVVGWNAKAGEPYAFGLVCIGIAATLIFVKHRFVRAFGYFGAVLILGLVAIIMVLMNAFTYSR